MNLHIRGGRLVDPSRPSDGPADLWIEDGLIRAILQPGEETPGRADRVVDATGAVVAPGLVDLHVHLREPGQTHKEDIASGTAAAVAGGFTSVLCMPNTSPANDSPEVTRWILSRAKETARCRVYPVGAISLGLKGLVPAPMEALQRAGCVAFSDDGRPVNNPVLLREALRSAKKLGAWVTEHCEELELSASPTIAEGDVARELGYAGIPVSVETLDAARTMMLAAETGARVHISHLSTADGVDLVRAFRAKFPGLSAEVTPHHLMLTDAAVREHGADAKMYPPLRSERDVDALRAALADGTVDAVATDHAPHTPEEKGRPFADAPNGVIGLETALPLLLTLVAGGLLSLSALIDRMSTRPARLAGLSAGSLAPGAPADVVVFDPDVQRSLTAADLRSKSRNTPFLGTRVRGKVLYTVVGGRIMFPEER